MNDINAINMKINKKFEWKHLFALEATFPNFTRSVNLNQNLDILLQQFRMIKRLKCFVFGD